MCSVLRKRPRLGCPINQLNAHPSFPQHKIHADSEVMTKVASRTLARLGKSFHSKSSLSVPPPTLRLCCKYHHGGGGGGGGARISCPLGGPPPTTISLPPPLELFMHEQGKNRRRKEDSPHVAPENINSVSLFSKKERKQHNYFIREFSMTMIVAPSLL